MLGRFGKDAKAKKVEAEKAAEAKKATEAKLAAEAKIAADARLAEAAKEAEKKTRWKDALLMMTAESEAADENENLFLLNSFIQLIGAKLALLKRGRAPIVNENLTVLDELVAEETEIGHALHRFFPDDGTVDARSTKTHKEPTKDPLPLIQLDLNVIKDAPLFDVQAEINLLAQREANAISKLFTYLNSIVTNTCKGMPTTAQISFEYILLREFKQMVSRNHFVNPTINEAALKEIDTQLAKLKERNADHILENVFSENLNEEQLKKMQDGLSDWGKFITDADEALKKGYKKNQEIIERNRIIDNYKNGMLAQQLSLQKSMEDISTAIKNQDSKSLKEAIKRNNKLLEEKNNIVDVIDTLLKSVGEVLDKLKKDLKKASGTEREILQAEVNKLQVEYDSGLSFKKQIETSVKTIHRWLKNHAPENVSLEETFAIMAFENIKHECIDVEHEHKAALQEHLDRQSELPNFIDKNKDKIGNLITRFYEFVSTCGDDLKDELIKKLNVSSFDLKKITFLQLFDALTKIDELEGYMSGQTYAKLDALMNVYLDLEEGNLAFCDKFFSRAPLSVLQKVVQDNEGFEAMLDVVRNDVNLDIKGTLKHHAASLASAEEHSARVKEREAEIKSFVMNSMKNEQTTLEKQKKSKDNLSYQKSPKLKDVLEISDQLVALNTSKELGPMSQDDRMLKRELAGMSIDVDKHLKKSKELFKLTSPLDKERHERFNKVHHYTLGGVEQLIDELRKEKKELVNKTWKFSPLHKKSKQEFIEIVNQLIEKLEKDKKTLALTNDPNKMRELMAEISNHYNSQYVKLSALEKKIAPAESFARSFFPKENPVHAFNFMRAMYQACPSQEMVDKILQTKLDEQFSIPGLTTQEIETLRAPTQKKGA